MTLLLRKKRQTIRLSIRPTNSWSIRQLKRIASTGAMFVLLVAFQQAFLGEMNAGESEPQLQWGRPGAAKQRQSNTQRQPNAQSRVARQILPRVNSLRHDSQVVAATWNEEHADSFVQVANQHKSIVIERRLPITESPIYGAPGEPRQAYDPFDEDDRLAQLPEDPFDDPFDEPSVVDESEVGEPVNDISEDIQDVEAAVDQEIERRRSNQDLLADDPADLLEVETPEVDPLEELEDEEPLADDPEDEETLQSESKDWDTPEYDFDEPETPEITPEQLKERSEEIQREREESLQSCREDLEDLQASKISAIDLSIRVNGNAGEDFPYECSVSTGSHQPRQWCEITYNWKASAICHKPLYFEQVQLERYGHSWGRYVQPIMSGVHFFGSVPLLPYKMGIRTPNECVYTLGYYRPGSCAPYMIDPIPFTWRAALFEGAVATGIPLIVP